MKSLRVVHNRLELEEGYKYRIKLVLESGQNVPIVLPVPEVARSSYWTSLPPEESLKNLKKTLG